jgi:5'-3' exonuclease
MSVILIDLSSVARSCWQVTDDPVAAFDGTLAAINRLTSGSPVGVGICCDAKGNWRKVLDPQYKAQREAAPDGYYKMLDRVKRRLTSEGYVLWQVDGYEADDVIASATACARELDHRVTIASADKDLLQLVTDHVHALRTPPLDWLDFGPAQVLESTGVRPDQVGMLLALMGDTSDNVKGCPGVGKKTAAEIVNQVTGWSDLWEKAKLPPGLLPNKGGVPSKVGLALVDNRPQIELAAKLVSLDSLVPLDPPFESIFTRRAPAAELPEPDIFEESTMPLPTPAPVPAVAPPPAPAGGRLARVVTGTVSTPLRALFYGPEGTGKTTLVASAPRVILFDVEGGSSLLDVARYPFRDTTNFDPGTNPLTFSEVLEAIKELATQPHGFHVLAIDTVDALERLIWDHVCKAKNVDGIEDLGYGKGYTAALDVWAKLLAYLERLQEKTGMGVALVGHAQIKKFANPSGEDFDRYQLKMHDKASALLREWSNLVGFLSFEDRYLKDSARAKAKAVGTGARVLSTERSAAADAKSRYRGMPAEITIDEAAPWASISPYLKGSAT